MEKKSVAKRLNNVEKYCRAGQVTGENIVREMRFACWVNKNTEDEEDNNNNNNIDLEEKEEEITEMENGRR